MALFLQAQTVPHDPLLMELGSLGKLRLRYLENEVFLLLKLFVVEHG